MQSTSRSLPQHLSRAVRTQTAPPHSVRTQTWRTIHTTSAGNNNNNPITRKASPFPIVQRNPRIVVGVTGATGTVYAIRLLEILRSLDIETHLILSKWAQATMKYETDLTWEHLHSLATHAYAMKDVAAPPSSGSFLHDGMIVVPCSMKTLAAVRAGYCDDLISRSADVSLKEGRKLVMVVRETPLSAECHRRKIGLQEIESRVRGGDPQIVTLRDSQTSRDSSGTVLMRFLLRADRLRPGSL
ncbi:putative phenylacrylic acid decarboxylase [Diplodia seriata]|uniref:Putative phenylacrylic acid decarboxylase n=1 Tax=Diplodia seriata TaxID=420778 RepID=A0A0G2DXU7_9PEZI|nr:putative phenylacrylic acid decarboxylase [Diplodia seriata]